MQHDTSQNFYNPDDNLGNCIFLLASYVLDSFMPSWILVFHWGGAEEYYTIYIIVAIDFNETKARTNNACYYKSSSQTVTS